MNGKYVTKSKVYDIDGIPIKLRDEDITMMQMVSDGYDEKTISQVMHQNEKTISFRFTTIRRRMNCVNKMHMITSLIRNQVIE